MTTAPRHHEFVVVGSGPAGQKAAIQAAKGGKSVAIVEQERGLGGACVHRGTIPSKTLREMASRWLLLRQNHDLFNVDSAWEVPVSRLMRRVRGVVDTHARYMKDQLTRNNIDIHHGRARFTSDRHIEVTDRDGNRQTLEAQFIVLATGSRPREPKGIPVDHEQILDSDSILSLAYLPRSLAVLGGGVIACEYASIFAALGIEVTIIDRAERPLSFLDPDLSDRFVASFENSGGQYLPGRRVAAAEWDGVSQIVTTLESGETIRTDKMLVACGRAANLDTLDLAAAGLTANDQHLMDVDENLRTAVPHIYAVGDMIGFPSLASASMDQGRQAVRHALGMDQGNHGALTPIGIYTIPDIASVGIDEQQAIQQHGGALTGLASFTEIARGQISAMREGMLKMVADPSGHQVLGFQIFGHGATELIHVGQMGMAGGLTVEAFVDNTFNFPTLAEAYRVAALDILNRRPSLGDQTVTLITDPPPATLPPAA